MKRILTFSGFPYCPESSAMAADVALIGIPHGTPYRLGELSPCSHSPAAIRKASEKFADMIDNFDFDLDGTLFGAGFKRIVDCGDVAGSPYDPVGNRERATRALSKVIGTGAIPIILGGDDSIPIFLWHAYENHGPMWIVQVDAHLDWRHELHGITEGRSNTMRRASEMPWVHGIVQVGLRGVGSARPQDLEDARDWGARIITADEVHRNGVDPILEAIPEDTSCVVTLDCDGIDPTLMPGVISPSPGGLTYTQVIQLLHGLIRKTQLVGFDLVELAPERDLNGLSALVAARILLNVIGTTARS